MKAAQHDHTMTVMLLVEAQANVNLQDEVSCHFLNVVHCCFCIAE